MSAHPQPVFDDSVSLSSVSRRSHEVFEAEWLERRKPTLGDSLTAGAYVLVYLLAYVAAGRAGLALVEWAWAAIFR